MQEIQGMKCCKIVQGGEKRIVEMAEKLHTRTVRLQRDQHLRSPDQLKTWGGRCGTPGRLVDPQREPGG